MLCPTAPNKLTPIKLKNLLKYLYAIHIENVLTIAPLTLYIIDITEPTIKPPKRHVRTFYRSPYFKPNNTSVTRAIILASPSFAPGANTINGLGIYASVIWSAMPKDVSVAIWTNFLVSNDITLSNTTNIYSILTHFIGDLFTVYLHFIII